MMIEENIPLARYTTFHIGGLARYFTAVQTAGELQEALAFAKEKRVPVFILGGGSNVLVRDAGFEGLVIKIEMSGVEVAGEAGKKVLIAGAGENWDALVARAVAEQWWGIENLSGIPGTVGGAVVQNIGAYGQALSQTLRWVEVLDTQSGEVHKLPPEVCAFGYRDSVFKKEDGRYVVLRAALGLSASPAPDVSYKDLKALFNDSSLDIAAIRAAVLKIRKGKFPDLSAEGTAGSFFKNPIAAPAEAAALAGVYPSLPQFSMPETAGVKIPLAWLLDHALGLRGAQVGGARLYENQLLVIAAKKNTPSADVEALARTVQKKVKEKLGIEIEPEVKII